MNCDKLGPERVGPCEEVQAPPSGAARDHPTLTSTPFSFIPPFKPLQPPNRLAAGGSDLLNSRVCIVQFSPAQDRDYDCSTCTRHWSSNGHCTCTHHPPLGRLIDLVFPIVCGLSYPPLLTRWICNFVTSHANRHPYDSFAHPFDASERPSDSSLSRLA